MKTLIVFLFLPFLFLAQDDMPKFFYSFSVGAELPAGDKSNTHLRDYLIKYNYPATSAFIRLGTLVGPRTYFSPYIKITQRNGMSSSTSGGSRGGSTKTTTFSVVRSDLAISFVSALRNEKDILFSYGFFVSGVMHSSGKAIEHSWSFSKPTGYSYASQVEMMLQFGTRVELWRQYCLGNHFLIFGLYAQLETKEVAYGRMGKVVGVQAGYKFGRSKPKG